MIKVMIADDHAMIREGLKHIIEFDENIRVIEETGSGKECLDKLNAVKPDILLLDINLPDMNGIDVLKFISKKKRHPKVLMLTVHSETEYLIKAIDMGADGYILKDSDSRELNRAINCVYNGDKFIQPSLIPSLNSKLIARDMEQDKIAVLSNRELEVLKLVAAGYANKDISDKLCISERTVKNHLSNVFKKIDCSDRTQAAVFCIRNGLVGLDV